MKRNHYGIGVDSEVPITGVMYPTQGVFDAMYYDSSSIDLDWEEHQSTCDLEDHDDCDLPEEQGTMLIGSWSLIMGQYEPDRSGEYAAIVGELYTQVVWSRYTTRCALCSPCYPGQGDLDSEGDFLAYTLPPDMQDDPVIVRYSVHTANSGVGL